MLAYETEALATEAEAEAVTKAFSVETEAKTKTFSLEAEARPRRLKFQPRQDRDSLEASRLRPHPCKTPRRGAQRQQNVDIIFTVKSVKQRI